MNRRLWTLVVALLAVALVALMTSVPSTYADSAGCTSINPSLSGTLFEGYNKSAGPALFQAGDVIQILVGPLMVGGDPGVNVTITPQSGSLVTATDIGNWSYTIPTTQDYRVYIENGGPSDATVSAACTAALPTATSVPATATAGPTQTASPVPSPAPGQWAGYTDGRLSGAPDEYYSIWCTGEVVTVYRADNGQGVLLATVPLADLGAMALNTEKTLQDPFGAAFRVRRTSQTSFVFFGTNGNSRPQVGSKTVDLGGCNTVVFSQSGPVVSVVIVSNPVNVLPTRTPTPNLTPAATATATAPPFDGDRDGVTVPGDLCPTYNVMQLPVENRAHGCPDMDRDGFSDPVAQGGQFVLDTNNVNLEAWRDLCINNPGPNQGCPTTPTKVDVVGSWTGADPSPVVATQTPVSPYWEWVSVSLAGQVTECTGGPDGVALNNFLGVEICNPDVYFTPNNGRVRYQGPGYQYGIWPYPAIPAGTRLLVEATNASRSWLYIRYNDVTGWIANNNGSIGQGEDLSALPIRSN